MSAVNNDVKKFWSRENKKKYEKAMKLLIRYIEKIDDENFARTGRSIIRYKEKRLKTTDSIDEKLKRKGSSNEVNIEKIINDLAGVRVVCFDNRQVYLLVDEIRKIEHFNILKEKDYIAHPKGNGYQSYHMIIEIDEVKVELQIRTILMDAWSSLDTVLIYKKKDKTPRDVMEKIRKFSKWSKKMDQMIEEMLEEKGKLYE